MRAVIVAVLLLCALVGSPATAHAYQDDVHFGLTLWLAKVAGFRPDQASRIAFAAVSYDRTLLSAVTLTAIYACVTRNADGASLVQLHHFPSDGFVPSRPQEREVTPRSNAARQEMNRVMGVPPSSEHQLLDQFGRGLHPFQDSWSHQGVPDAPGWPCHPNYGFGHPATRGGWRKHNADLTHLYPADADAMARGTYEMLCQLRATRFADRCARTYDDIRDEVGQFIAASTKVQKSAWLSSRGVHDLEFVADLSLDVGNQWFGVESKYATEAAAPLQAGPTTDESARFLLEFFEAWLSTSDVAQVQQRYTDVGRFTSLSAPTWAAGPDIATRPNANQVQADLLLKRAAIQNRYMETDKISRVPTLPELQALGQFSSPAGVRARLYLPFDSTGKTMETWNATGVDGEPVTVAAVRPASSPRELFLAVATRIGNQLRVTELLSFPIDLPSPTWAAYRSAADLQSARDPR